MNVIELLKSSKYNNAYIAVKLYRDIKERSAISKLHNKLYGVKGRKLSESEIKEIEAIFKEYFTI